MPTCIKTQQLHHNMLLIQLKARFKKEWFALRCAAAGLVYFFLNERKTMLYTISTVLVIVAGACTKVSRTEWILLALSVCSVWAAEMFNSCMEEILNFLHPHRHEKVKHIKDMAAGAVLFTGTGSIITGLIIFLPKLF